MPISSTVVAYPQHGGCSFVRVSNTPWTGDDVYKVNWGNCILIEAPISTDETIRPDRI